ncbi:MAG TPA: hypothetical protein P5567_07530 [Kiritimatiellia bacterium]|nr:hypothetical protein [Kiritimatiellia bacterium]HSA17952.1 hypothetical protein [Kiritimatiellia bacterium]
MNQLSFSGEWNPEGAFWKNNVVFFANEDRFEASHYSEPLTIFAQGWSDPAGIKAILDFVAPEVPAPRRFDFKRPASNAEAFAIEDNDIRAIGSGFKTVDFTSESQESMTLNKGLCVRLDDDVLADNPQYEEIYVGALLSLLYRMEFKRAVTALESIATAASKTWNSAASPDDDVAEMLSAAEDASGLANNRLLYGQLAFRTRCACLRVASDGKAAMGAGGLDQLALTLGVSGIRVSGHRYQETATTKGRIVPSAAFSFYGSSENLLDDPTHIKRFITPIEKGQTVRVFRERIGVKVVELGIEFYSRIVAASTVGARVLNIV